MPSGQISTHLLQFSHFSKLIFSLTIVSQSIHF
jgi:hypothetical protein